MRRRSAEELRQPPQVLRHRGEQHLVLRTRQAAQAQPIEPVDALHVGEPHLDLLGFPARALEGLGVGQGTHPIAHVLVDVAGDLACDRRRALALSSQMEQSFFLAR